MWKLKDSGLYDLICDGVIDLNWKILLNFNIVYKIYIGELIYKILVGK